MSVSCRETCHSGVMLEATSAEGRLRSRFVLKLTQEILCWYEHPIATDQLMCLKSRSNLNMVSFYSLASALMAPKTATQGPL